MIGKNNGKGSGSMKPLEFKFINEYFQLQDPELAIGRRTGPRNQTETDSGTGENSRSGDLRLGMYTGGVQSRETANAQGQKIEKIKEVNQFKSNQYPMKSIKSNEI